MRDGIGAAAGLRRSLRRGTGSARALAMLAVMLAMSLPFAAGAVQPDEILKDPKLEARAREISAGLRCLVCQNQSIDDSNAPLARDLRLLVRERLEAGDTNDKVLAFVVHRYGEFVLLKPPLNIGTALLWVAPLLLFLAAVLIARRQMRGAVTRSGEVPAEAPLTPQEAKRLEEILGKRS